MIIDFILDKMSSYIAGGMKPATAAHFTCEELEAIYKGNHYSRDNVGKMRSTVLPECLSIETAMKKADAVINDLLKGKEAGKNIAHDAYLAGKAPENTARKTGPNDLEGFEKLSDYRGNWWTQY